MKHLSDLPDTIAVFPLSGALLLPRSRMPLHVFEPRYLQMIDDCLKTPERLIGMVQPREVAANADEGRAPLHSVGCVGRLVGFTETDDGRYMISLAGLTRFRIGAEIEGFAPYRRVQADWSSFASDLRGAEEDAGFDRDGFLAKLVQFFQAMELSTDWSSLREADEELLINSLSMLCPFSPEDKQALLEAPSLTKRRETVETLIEFALRGGPGEEMMQ